MAYFVEQTWFEAVDMDTTSSKQTSKSFPSLGDHSHPFLRQSLWPLRTYAALDGALNGNAAFWDASKQLDALQRQGFPNAMKEVFRRKDWSHWGNWYDEKQLIWICFRRVTTECRQQVWQPLNLICGVFASEPTFLWQQLSVRKLSHWIAWKLFDTYNMAGGANNSICVFLLF